MGKSERDLSCPFLSALALRPRVAPPHPPLKLLVPNLLQDFSANVVHMLVRLRACARVGQLANCIPQKSAASYSTVGSDYRTAKVRAKS